MKLNKKGITLVEAVVTLAISSIVLVAISFALQNFSNQYTAVKRRMEAKNVATLVYQTIEGKVRVAKGGLIYADDSLNTSNIITSRNGRLFLDTAAAPEGPLMDEQGYSKLNCNVAFSKKDNSTVHLEITVYAGTATANSTMPPAQPLYTLTRDLRLLNTLDSVRDFGTASDIVSLPSGVPATFIGHRLRFEL